MKPTSILPRLLILLAVLAGLAACNGSPESTTQGSSSDATAVLVTDTPAAARPITPSPDGTSGTSVTHLHDTTVAGGSFILFLRPDSARFESLASGGHPGIYEADSDFGFGIEGTRAGLFADRKYRHVKVLVSTDRYITINDCKSCPLTIDRDTVNFGVILSAEGKALRTTYNSVHGGDYLQEIAAYFNGR